MSQTTERKRTRSGTRQSADALATRSTLSDSGFASPSQFFGESSRTTTEELRTAAGITRSVSLLDDTSFSPPTVVVRCEASSSTPLLASSGGMSGGHVTPCQYFLRHQRWASTPLIHKETHQTFKSQSVPFTSVISGTPAAADEFSCASATASTASLDESPSEFSVPLPPPERGFILPATAAMSPVVQLSHAEFQQRLSAAAAADTILESSHSQSIDSGFESLTGHETLSEDSQSSFLGGSNSCSSRAAAPPKRRSPRRLIVSTTAALVPATTSRLAVCTVDDTDRLIRLRLGRRIQSSSPATGSAVRVLPPSCQDRAHVDMLRLLAERDLWGALDLVLGCLSPADLCAVALVSQVWNVALASRPYHEERRRSYALAKRLDRENFGAVAEGGLMMPRRIRSSPRLAMQEVSNMKNISPSWKRNRNGSTSSANIEATAAGSSPSKIRHRLFVEEAAKLPPGGRLVHCPHCSAPSRVEQQPLRRGSTSQGGSGSSSPSGGEPNFGEVAVCSSVACGLVFCLACRCDRHEGPCRNLRSGANNSRRTGGVSSKKSKARLRRL